MNLFSFIEKRKQIQIYTLFTFLSSSLSYFDFSSFELMENFQEFTILKSKKTISSFNDILLGICLFTQKNNYFINKSLKKFLIHSSTLTSKKKSALSLFEKIYFTKNYKEYKKLLANEIKDFYEEAVKKSLVKYKTPVITSEIFILTSISQNPIFFKNFLKFFIKNQKQWFLLKYKLVRHIYFENYFLNNSINKNLLNYTYLLDKYSFIKKTKKIGKNQIESNFFEQIFKIMKKFFRSKKKLTIIKKDNESILKLRSLLFSSLLKSNFQKILEDDILLNVKDFSKRKYKNNPKKKFK
jgi:hypothetical protein|uniref:ClpN n=1 Tax=Poterioochromonas malhamensis TaxID=88167 RepID=A0A7T6Y7L6_9STRA|nr:ClpN [Poterioochromonas malhamensis]QQK55018.1 ClpN [Poterioochromonas malhamensis]